MVRTEAALEGKEQEKYISKRIVVKIGSSTITRDGTPFNRDFMDDIARQVSVLHKNGVDVAIVSSGAVAGGEKIVKKTGTRLRNPHEVAVIGQQRLISEWKRAFNIYGVSNVFQVLLTDNSLEYSKAVLRTGVRCGIPVVNGHPLNEKSAFSANNDNLAGWVAIAIGADTLLLLTDVQGTLENNQHHKPLPYIDRLEDIEDDMQKTGIGTGGMWSKCLVAHEAARAGVRSFIVRGQEPDVILYIARGGRVGTQFLPGYARY